MILNGVAFGIAALICLLTGILSYCAGRMDEREIWERMRRKDTK